MQDSLIKYDLKLTSTETETEIETGNATQE